MAKFVGICWAVSLLSILTLIQSYSGRYPIGRRCCERQGSCRLQHDYNSENRMFLTSSYYRSSALPATKLQWEDILGKQEPPTNPMPLPVGCLDSLSTLLNSIEDQQVQHINVDELQEQWIDYCIEQSKAEDFGKFSLGAILPMIMKSNTLINLVNKTIESCNEVEPMPVYITEQELRRIWREDAQKPMGKSMDKFKVAEALLLVDDEDIPHILDSDTNDWARGATSSSSSSDISDLAIELHISQESSSSLDLSASLIEEKETLVITSQELERIWQERADIKWGLPSPQFEAKAALLLLDPDDDEELEFVPLVPTSSKQGQEEEEDGYGEATTGDSTSGRLKGAGSWKRPQYVSAAEAADEPLAAASQDQGFWDRFSGRSNQLLRETLRRMYLQLEVTPHYRPAWKKDRNFLTPDLDTQEFMGDVMFSNTYMTKRIPANWEDPEREEMSEAYLSTGTMAMPGEVETDFNLKIPLWEQLNLEVGPQYSGELGLEAQLLRELKESGQAQATEVAGSGTGVLDKEAGIEEAEVDWDNFDFTTALEGSQSQQGQAEVSGFSFSDEIDSSGVSLEQDDLDDFYSAFRSGSGSSDRVGGLDDDEDDAEGEEGEDADDGDEDDSLDWDSRGMRPSTDAEIAARNREVLRKKAEKSTSSVKEAPWLSDNTKWKTPAEWISHPRFKTHVGHEVWSVYGPKYFEETDDTVWDEDVYLAEAMEHVNEVTDVYLTDHLAAAAAWQRRKYWDRVIDTTLDKHSTSAPTSAHAHSHTQGEEGEEGEEGGSSVDPVTGSTAPFREPIPTYMMPDATRGIRYSNEVIELKSKLILHPARLPPEVEYANDTFTHNTEVRAMNMIGTCRDQYDWQPRRELESQYVVEEEKLPRIKPILDYINHAGKLISTKDNVLVFDYLSQMRHIIGIRASMLKLARTHCPEIVDIRLETERTHDKFDK